MEDLQRQPEQQRTTRRRQVLWIILAGFTAFVLFAWGMPIIGYFDFKTGTSFGNPPAGFGRVFVDSGTLKLACTNPDGSSCAPSGGGGYATIQSQGSAQTQQTTVNFIGPYLNCVNNSGSSRTDCTEFGPLPPTVGASTWVNQASATTSSTNGVIAMSDSANEDGLHLLVNTLPATPYTITLQFSYYMNWVTSKYPLVEFALRESGTGKIEEIDVGINQGFPGSQVPSTLAVNQWTNATTLASTVANAGPFSGPLSCFRLADDGANKTYLYSADCQNFTQLFSEAHAAFMTANQWGWGIRTNSSAGQIVIGSVISFLQQ